MSILSDQFYYLEQINIKMDEDSDYLIEYIVTHKSDIVIHQYGLASFQDEVYLFCSSCMRFFLKRYKSREYINCQILDVQSAIKIKLPDMCTYGDKSSLHIRNFYSKDN